jgi:glutathione S-transferase
VGELAALLRSRLDVFEHLLADGEFLFGDTLTVADVCAFPFLKYALLHDPQDTETFHRVLMEHQVLGDDHPRLRSWIERMDALPRA